MEEKSTFELMHRVRRANGTVGWVLSRAVPILTPDGGVREWFGPPSTSRSAGKRNQLCSRGLSASVCLLRCMKAAVPPADTCP